MEPAHARRPRPAHRSWAQARGVPPVLIDKQLGHADPGEFEVMRALAGSETSRKRYLDLGSELFDAGRVAQAVRDLLDEAVVRAPAVGTLVHAEGPEDCDEDRLSA